MKIKHIFILIVMVLLALPAYSDIQDNLVGHWKLDETSGSTAYDSTDNHNDGTINDATQGVAGKFGTAYSLAGDNDYITMGDSPFDISGALSLAAWINPAEVETREFVSKAGTSVGEMAYRLRLTSSGSVEFGVSGDGSSFAAGGEAASSTGIISAGNWYHIVGVYIPSTSVKVYVNGTEAGSDTTSVTASIYNCSIPFRIGGNVPGSAYFNGTIDDVGVWDKALSQAEIDFMQTNQIPEPVSAMFALAGIGMAIRTRREK